MAAAASGSTGTATIMFTDLVGSTALRTRIGEDAAEALRRAHDRLLAEAVTASEGSIVKGLGDGVMAVFGSAADAVAAAVATQQAIERHNRVGTAEALSVRIGVSAGDVTWEDGDCHGTPVVEAARLCDAADRGEILVSEVVRLLAGSRGGDRFSGAGALELKGLAGPREAWRVEWAPAAPAAPLPPALSVPEAAGFVGRRPEAAALAEAWRTVEGGERRAVLIAGEPGIGKSRLARERARAAHEAGGLVLFGRCDEELGVPYQPFAEAVAGFAAATPAAELGPVLGPLGGELARLVPELRDAVPSLPEPLRAEAETERYRLFEAVGDLLAALSAARPVLLVLDDLHWAAKPTLLLLRHLLRRPEQARVLVIGTYRDTELGRTHALSEMLADLRSQTGVERLALSGLDSEDVAAIMEATAGHALGEAGEALAAAVYEETEGNPFFVGEVLRHLAESGAVVRRGGRWTAGSDAVEGVGIPEGVREVVGRRLSRLSDVANRALAVASVIGSSFDAAIVGAAGGPTGPELLDALDEAVRARLLVEDPVRIDRYAFTHSLVRHTLYEELTTNRRVRLHRAVGEAIEAVHAGEVDTRLPDLSHHFGEGALAGGAAKAVDYARRAGDQARARLAFEEAAAQFERALAALELLDAPDPALRCDLETGWGDALRRAGDGRYRGVLLGAISTARDLADGPRLAGAVLALNPLGTPSQGGSVDQEMVALAEEALDAIGRQPVRLRARLLALLAIELSWDPDYERRGAISREAVALARRSRDPATLARVLACHHDAALTPDNLDERLAVDRELIALGEESGDLEALSQGHRFLYEELVELGDLARAASHLAEAESTAAELREPYWTYNVAVHRAVQQLLAGRFEDAERLILEAVEQGARAGISESVLMTVAGGQIYVLRYEQGRLSEIEETVTEAVESDPRNATWRAALSLLYAESDRPDEAGVQLERAVARDFADVPHDATWFFPVMVLAHVASAVHDESRSALLYDLLVPYHGRNSWVGMFSIGPVDLALGVAAAALGRRDDAERHFDAAAGLARRMGTPSFLARTQHAWAAMLSTEGEAGRRRSRELARDARATAQQLGMTRVAEKSDALLASLEEV